MKLTRIPNEKIKREWAIAVTNYRENHKEDFSFFEEDRITRRAIAQAQLESCEKEAGEILYDQTMKAKRSGWDDAEKFYTAQFQEKVREIFEEIEALLQVRPILHKDDLQALKQKWGVK